jgi:hypothetical protein
MRREITGDSRARGRRRQFRGGGRRVTGPRRWLVYVAHARLEVRSLAACLLHQALAAAEAMQIPEAAQIRAILRHHALP